MTGVSTLLTPNPAKGSQTATIGTEHTLASSTAVASDCALELDVDLSNMVDGDTVELRIYSNANGVAADKLCYQATFSNAQTVQLAVSIPKIVPGGGRFKATLKQVAGTGRAFDWQVVQP